MPRHCIIFCFLLFALTANGSSLETISSAWASQYGEVPINKDYYGFYVDVDYSYQPSKTRDMTRMLIGLSNCETLLPASCATFDHFELSQHNYTVWSYYNTTIEYPSFSAYAYQIKTDAYMDYSNWQLKNYAYVAGTCTAGPTSFGYGRGGLIALGNDDGAWQNYKNSTVFSIYIQKDLNGGKLLFRYEPSLATSPNPIVITTDSNYRISFSNGNIKVGSYSTYFSGLLTFDIHAKAIGFPDITFTNMISYLQLAQGITCSNDKTNPTCNYYGYLYNLPTLKLTVNSKVIELPPEVYVKNPSSGYLYGITLNLQALSPSLSGSNYVTRTFQNAVIMDAQFMSYYYLVFERYRVNFYIQGTPETHPKGIGTEIIVVGVVTLVVVVICVGVCKKKKKLAKPSLPTSQDPSMNQPSYNQAPVQPNNGYVYPQNNYPAIHQNGQYAQQPAGYVQQPGYYPPPQQFQQPGYVNYGA